MNKRIFQAGVTLPEVMMAISVTTILIGGLSFLVGRNFTISRQGFEQVRIVEDGRKEMNRMVHAVRNARDTNNLFWLVIGGPYTLQMYTNIDGDTDTELVRYFLDGTDLKRGVIEAQGGVYNPSNEAVMVLSRSIRNSEQSIPLFTYAATDAQTIDTIGIELVIDVSAEKPDAAHIKTSAAA